MDASLLHIDPTLPDPIYRQIVEQIRRLTSAGQLRPGDALPSVRDVAATHAINPMTVSRAYSQLETEGVLVRLRGRGMSVAARATDGGDVDARMGLLDPVLREAARHCRELELPADRVLARLRHLIEEKTP